MYYIYILKLRDDTFYMGYSSELKSRIKNHIQGNVPQTRNLRPIILVFYAAFESKLKALHFEQYLKTGSGFAFRNRHFV
ncbi:GIY-YIG nuclease family protein [Candidatus Gottesmanbacteria bacterium]|nr:GIY-YIG nuclease family protein [Candidatus Gottesmanbacteria bacterium]MBI3559703.1 GIY-YIG nuclease family protein [Candidatus Gottesmanbacteria bacterium]